MAKTATPIRYAMDAGEVKAFKFSDYSDLRVSKDDLNAFGISMDESLLPDLKQHFAMDAALQTVPSITNPIQFFQYWIPNAVEYITSARKIDDIVGRTIAGSFEDEEIVLTLIENTGTAEPYTDTTNIPFASWNQNFETRSIVRFEQGVQVGYLEAARASRMRIDDHNRKTEGAARALAIELNRIGFFGYADGTNKTYGLLNDPFLPAYITVAEGEKAETTWSSKTFEEITQDIITAMGKLTVQLAGNFSPDKDSCVMTVALSAYQELQKMNALGTKSVLEWLKETYRGLRLEVAPEFDGANGGSNVFYIIVDRVGSAKVVDQYVQEVLRLVGMEKRAKVTIEDFASATAGVFVQQPIGIVRYSGI